MKRIFQKFFPHPPNPVEALRPMKQQTMAGFFDFAAGVGTPPWPVEVFLEVSNICDLKCAMCPVFSGLNPKRGYNLKKQKRGFIDIEHATRPMTAILEHALVVHAFGYGEPTIHPKFPELLDFVSKFEVMIDFFTNGMHFTEAFCQSLVDKRVVKVTISFSGATQEDYENIYLGGDFKRVLKGLRCLADTKARANTPYPLIEINSLGFKHHVQKLPAFVELMAESGVDHIHLKPLQTYDDITELHTHVSVMRPDIEGAILEQAKAKAREHNLKLFSLLYEQTASRQKAGTHKGARQLCEDETDIHTFKERIKSAREQKKFLDQPLPPEIEPVDPDSVSFIQNQNTPCLEPFKTFYVSMLGDVYPCCFKNNLFSLGNLGRENGEAVWNGALFAKLREHALQGEYPKVLCGGCLKAGTYPKHHSINQKVATYANWRYPGDSQGKFTDEIQSAAKLPDNETILANHRRGSDALR